MCRRFEAAAISGLERNAFRGDFLVRQMVERDLPAVWEWFDYRRGLLPYAIRLTRRIERSRGGSDAFRSSRWLHRTSTGCISRLDRRDVIELHGSIWRARVYGLPIRDSRLIARSRGPMPVTSVATTSGPMWCCLARCYRPERLNSRRGNGRECELCFVIGTSALVYPAAGLPEIARSAGAYVCEVNPERTPLSDLCDEVLTGKAGEVLPLIACYEPMKTLYFDCFAGASGDMILGAMVGAGVDPKRCKNSSRCSTSKGIQLDFQTVDRSGFSATYARVETAHEHEHRHLV